MKRLKVEACTYSALALYLNSGDEDYPGCNLFLRLGRWSATLKLPAWVLRPHRQRVDCPQWDAATVARLGRDWYWNFTQRQYGVSICDGLLGISYGRQTWDSSTEQRWCWGLPWQQWRHVRHSLYDLQGRHYWTAPKMPRGYASDGYELLEVKVGRMPKAEFLFTDFDGEENRATAYIEEREWHRGEGWFRWLKYLWRPKIHRSLDLRFDKAVGPKKGSWKGGTISHSIELQEDELHASAFRRYCEQHQLNFIATVFQSPDPHDTKLA